MNAYMLSTALLYLFAFFGQRIGLIWPKNTLLIVAVVLILKLNPIYSEALRPLLLLLVFFTLSYLQTRKVSQAALLSSLPLINYTYSVAWTVDFPWPLWQYTVVNLLIIAILTLIQRTLLNYISDRIMHYLYLLPLLHLFYLYYQQMLVLLNYLFSGQDTRLEIFQGIILAAVVLFISTLVLFQHNETQVIYQEQLRARTQIDREYLHLTSQQYQEMRKFRHDYQNILLSIEGFIRAEAWPELRTYFDQELSYLLPEGQADFEKLILLENANLRQILYAKLAAAQLAGVKVNLELTESILIQHPDQLTISRMLGIIVDNAIEEVASLGKDALMTVAFIQESSETIILVINDCRTDLDSLNILEKEGYSSKGSGRGFGLSNLATMQARSEFIVNTELSDVHFSQEIIISNKLGGVEL